MECTEQETTALQRILEGKNELSSEEEKLTTMIKTITKKIERAKAQCQTFMFENGYSVIGDKFCTDKGADKAAPTFAYVKVRKAPTVTAEPTVAHYLEAWPTVTHADVKALVTRKLKAKQKALRIEEAIANLLFDQAKTLAVNAKIAALPKVPEPSAAVLPVSLVTKLTKVEQEEADHTNVDETTKAALELWAIKAEKLKLVKQARANLHAAFDEIEEEVKGVLEPYLRRISGPDAPRPNRAVQYQDTGGEPRNFNVAVSNTTRYKPLGIKRHKALLAQTLLALQELPATTNLDVQITRLLSDRSKELLGRELAKRMTEMREELRTTTTKINVAIKQEGNPNKRQRQAL